MPLSQQLNPAGLTWTSSQPWFGAATLAIMQAAGASHPIGDSPAFGTIPVFSAAARATAQAGYETEFRLLGTNRISLSYYAPTEINDVQFAQDIYLVSADGQPRTSVWWSPVSIEEAVVVDRVFFGGTNHNFNFDWAQNEHDVLDRFVSAGPDDQLPGILIDFYASGTHPNFPFPLNQWFTLMGNLTAEQSGASYSLWVKTQDTIAANPPFIDPRMASGDISPIDGDPVGWICTYPGYVDDERSQDVVEGVGIASKEFDVEAPTYGIYGQAPHWNLALASTFDSIQYGFGSDDENDPQFAADDYFFGPLRVNGQAVEPQCPPVSLQEAKIRPINLSTSDSFGRSVAIGDDIAIIAAPSDTTSAGVDSGSVYIFERQPDSTWTQIDFLIPPDLQEDDSLGVGLHRNGDLLAIGAPGRNGSANDDGAAYVYIRDEFGDWNYSQTLLAESEELVPWFGGDVHVTPELFLVGADETLGEVFSAGSVYVYQRSGSAPFTFQTKLTAVLPVNGAHFGSSMTVDEESVLIGAPAGFNSASAGAVHIFERTPGGDIVPHSVIPSPNPMEFDLFGASISLEGDRLLIGAPGLERVYLYERSAPLTWTLVHEFAAPGDEGFVNDRFGEQALILGDIVAIGAPLADLGSINNAGVVHVFRETNGVWNAVAVLSTCDASADDQFGAAFVIESGRLLAGVDGDNGGGSAYTFDISSFTCPQDLTSDQMVNGADLADLLAAWGMTETQADLNGDGVVNGADLAMLLANWGPCT